ncbi:hypothetical protein [Streptomyces sp. NPDC055912]|uniref:hypothetical protein n=1 Tax=Streptomyces sp. NPDC055912 TaxID=3345660 RepID=UPI0035DFBF76
MLVAMGLMQLFNVPFKGADTSFWWAFGISLALGVLIYWNSLSSQMTRNDKALGAAIAFVNALLLTGSALGLGSLTSGDPASF